VKFSEEHLFGMMGWGEKVEEANITKRRVTAWVAQERRAQRCQL
jgi:hypothetical protein